MTSDEEILTQAKEQVANKLSYKSWEEFVINMPLASSIIYQEKAAILALQLKGEQMEKEISKLKYAFDEMYKIADEYYVTAKESISKLNSEIAELKTKIK